MIGGAVTVLLVEDNLGDARLLREMLRDPSPAAYDVRPVESLKAAGDYLAGNAADIVLLDLGLPDADGLESLQTIRAAAPRVPVVVLTGRDDESLAVQALNEGAQDYLVKGQIDARGLRRALRYAMERAVWRMPSSSRRSGPKSRSTRSATRSSATTILAG